MYKFSYKDWTAVHKKDWESLLVSSGLLEEKDKVIIEVGCFEGRSTVWFAERLLNTPASRYFCIDNWSGGEEIDRLNLGYNMQEVYQNFCYNISLLKNKHQLTYQISESEKALAQLCSIYYRQADFIYLDGSHTQRDTLVDLTLSLTMLKKGGILIVDDYTNKMHTNDMHLRPQKAVDFVVSSLKNEISMFQTAEFQAVIKRNY